jgi:hypothetical protein
VVAAAPASRRDCTPSQYASRIYEAGEDLQKLRKSTSQDQPYAAPYVIMKDKKNRTGYLLPEPRLPGL